MKYLKRIKFNSPVILTFTIICVAALITDTITLGLTNRLFFSVYRSSALNPLTYVRMIGHIFGHADWNHLINNIMVILIVGPLLEEKYGSKDMIFVIVTTAIITGIAHVILSPFTALLGASGVVFAFILLASFTSFKDGEIPLTFILVALLYIGTQIYDAVFVVSNVSNLTHIIGGIVGALIGYIGNPNSEKAKLG